MSCAVAVASCHASDVQAVLWAVAAVLSASVAECHQHTKPEISAQQNLLKQNVVDGNCCKPVELLECSISKASELVCDITMPSLM